MVICYTAEVKKCSHEKVAHEEFTKRIIGKQNIAKKCSVVKGGKENLGN